VTEKNLKNIGIRRVGDLARLDESFLAEKFGKWGLALAGKSRGKDAGGWFDSPIGAGEDAKSISHEHTFNEDTCDVEKIEATLARLAEMVGRRLRESRLHSRTVQLKLRYSDFTTLTRAHTLRQATQIDTELAAEAKRLFHANWKKGAKVRLLGVHAGSLSAAAGQMNLLDGSTHERWHRALEAADRMRDRFPDATISLAGALRGTFRERVHEALPEKKEGKPDR
jgi:DNA polymerase-4